MVFSPTKPSPRCPVQKQERFLRVVLWVGLGFLGLVLGDSEYAVKLLVASHSRTKFFLWPQPSYTAPLSLLDISPTLKSLRTESLSSS